MGCKDKTSVYTGTCHLIGFSDGCIIRLFLTFSVSVANPKKLDTVAYSARGVLNREKITK